MLMLVLMHNMHIVHMFMLICMLITPITMIMLMRMLIIMPIIIMQICMRIIMTILHITHSFFFFVCCLRLVLC